MAYKPIGAAQIRWRKVNAPELVAPRPTDITPESSTAMPDTAGSDVA